MNSDNVVIFFVVGISLVNGTGHGYLFTDFFDYMHLHREPLTEVMFILAAVAFFIAWLAFNKAKMDEEDSN